MPARLSAIVSRQTSRALTSPALRTARRRLHDWRRRIAGGEAVLRYFHQPDDPYSALAATVLPQLADRYRIRIETHAVPPPASAAAPDMQRLIEWSRRDAHRLAAHHGIAPLSSPPPGLTIDAKSMQHGERLRARLGHYLGAMFHFEGEWYWGVDRLHHLETRLRSLGLARQPASSGADAAPLVPPPALQWLAPPPAPRGARPTLHFYCSLRSPYTWLATGQLRRLAAHYGAELRLRMVLPMVMRGLPVPWPKRRYILLDTQREAERLGLPFGRVADPVGAPTERGIALVQHALAQDAMHGHRDSRIGMAVAESFLRGVFAEGIDAGSDTGLARIAARAGLDADAVRAALADGTWRTVVEDNRRDMLGRGLWGVPSFRVDEAPALWGQDRLWMLEQDLIAALDATPPGAPT
jgi:2-hydroxychromene-2-carboxylate isomerase